MYSILPNTKALSTTLNNTKFSIVSPCYCDHEILRKPFRASGRNRPHQPIKIEIREGDLPTPSRLFFTSLFGGTSDDGRRPAAAYTSHINDKSGISLSRYYSIPHLFRQYQNVLYFLPVAIVTEIEKTSHMDLSTENEYLEGEELFPTPLGIENNSTALDQTQASEVSAEEQRSEAFLKKHQTGWSRAIRNFTPS